MRKFKTESKKLLDLMINSIYTNREIFLRELISNASDAVDKLYFRSLTDGDTQINRADLAITISFDKDKRVVTVSDNGIGMTKDELDKNLGTIAHSDSFTFMDDNVDADADDADAEGKKPDIDIIGQFGVGFYSAFMVGKKVRVVSRAYGSDEAWAWESDGIEGYTITPAERAEHGTDVIVLLKGNTEDENYDRFATENGLTDLIKRYSNYVRYPIQMEVEKSRMLPKPPDAPEDYKPEFENYIELETINSMIPIWKRKKSDVTQEEYDEFYKSDFHDYEAPARTISLHAEGALTYDALLFVPSHAPYDLYSRDFKKGLALYSSNVLIMEKCEELLPDYFGFVCGVVDSVDLTLNISRETLQHNSQLRAIARRVEKKIKADLADMRDNDREAYEKIFKELGRTMKYGLYSSYGAAKDVVCDLLLYYSAKQKKMITFDEYIADAPEGSDSIFYAAGDSVQRLVQTPAVTTVLAKGHDVLLCDQDIDEFCMMSIATYDVGEGDDAKSYTLKNVGGEDLGLESEEEKKEAEEATEQNAELFDVMKGVLDGKVDKIVVSTRQTDAPVVLTTEGAMSLNLSQVFKDAPIGSDEVPELHLTMEVNASNPVFDVLKKAHADGDDDKVESYTKILYDQAMLAEGMPIDDPIAFSKAITELMK